MKNKTEKYARYKAEDLKEKNRQRKLRKVFKRQPNNLQVKALIK